MTRDPYEWELPGNDIYFRHTRDNGDNYYEPDSWDIDPNTPPHLIESFNAMIEDIRRLKEIGFYT